MIDLTSIDHDVLLARGQYSTVRAAHEDEKKRLSILCGQLTAAASQVLRHMQPGEDDAPDIKGVNDMLSAARKTLEAIEECVTNIEALAVQRGSLKQSAWGRK